jgi:AcrR family transcriptional regulator
MQKQIRGKHTMELVLDAALESFIHKESGKTSVHDLAQLSAVSIGSIYHHFGGRERIEFDLYCRCMRSLLSVCTNALKKRRSARTGVEALVRAYLAWVKDHPNEASFIYAAAHNEFVVQWHAELRAFKQELLVPIFAWFAPYIERGDVVRFPLPLYEIVIIGPVAEFSRRWLSGADGLDVDVAMRLLPASIWRAVKS